MLSDARRCIPDAQSVFALQRGGCSAVDWAERIADAIPHRQKPVVYVNVGANKGYRVPEFLALWSQRPVVGHMKAWQQHLLRYASEHNFKFLKAYSCGNCGDCKGRLPAPHNRTGAKMHLLELAATNRALLSFLLDAERLSGRVKLHHLAASNETRDMLVPKNIFAGDERSHFLTGRRAVSYQQASATDSVRAVALDDFFREQKLESLYHVAIDTEGWDALVVEGMRHTLAQRRVAVLEFEVNGGGMWSFERKRGGQSPGRTVEHTLSMLHSAGYACFWLLKNALLPASGACWLPEFGGRPKWSNIVCAHEPQVIRVLDDMAREAYVSRQSVRQQGAVPTSVAAA